MKYNHDNLIEKMEARGWRVVESTSQRVTFAKSARRGGES